MGEPRARGFRCGRLRFGMGQREQVNYSSEAAQCQHKDRDTAAFGGGERLGGDASGIAG